LRLTNWNYTLVARLGGWKREETIKNEYGSPVLKDYVGMMVAAGMVPEGAKIGEIDVEEIKKAREEIEQMNKQFIELFRHVEPVKPDLLRAIKGRGVESASD